MDFLAFAHICGPTVDPVTTTAIVRTESAFDPLVIRDNTLKATYIPKNREQAERLVRASVAAGHRVAIGLMQITAPWASRLKLKPEMLLDACTNITVGTAILAANYRLCAVHAETPAGALVCALSAYWSGNGRTGGVYVNQVFKMAGSPLRVEETPGVTDGVLSARRATPTVPAFEVFRYHSHTFSYSDLATMPFDLAAPAAFEALTSH
jgi:type IV secretion system protein VirB1